MKSKIRVLKTSIKRKRNPAPHSRRVGRKKLWHVEATVSLYNPRGYTEKRSIPLYVIGDTIDIVSKKVVSHLKDHGAKDFITMRVILHGKDPFTDVLE